MLIRHSVILNKRQLIWLCYKNSLRTENSSQFSSVTQPRRKCRHLNKDGVDIEKWGSSFRLFHLTIDLFLRYNRNEYQGKSDRTDNCRAKSSISKVPAALNRDFLQAATPQTAGECYCLLADFCSLQVAAEVLMMTQLSCG